MGVPLAIAAGAGLAGTLYGANAADKEGKYQRALLEQALAEYSGIDIPLIEDQMLNLGLYGQAGEYEPILEQLQELGPSAMEDVSTDPRLALYQQQALGELADIASQGGLTDADRAGMELARRKAANEAQAKSQQILLNEAQRGREGAMGRNLAAQLMNAQSAADRLSEEDLKIQQMALDRALQSQQLLGNMAGQVRGQEFGEQSDIARAKDIINQFNTQNSIATQQRNVQSQNQAQQQNLRERQRIADANVGTQNQQQRYNKELQQTRFQNEMDMANARANALTGQAQQAGQQAAQQGQMWSQFAQGLGTLGAAAMKKPTNQQTSNATVQPKPQFSAQDLIDYNYDEYGNRRS